MAKLEWGRKHICSECSTKFYDMNKPTPECPKCGSQIVISRKPRVGRPPLSQTKATKTIVETQKTQTISQKNTPNEKQNFNESKINNDSVEEAQEIENIENIDDIEEIDDQIDVIGDEIEDIEEIEDDVEDINEINNINDKNDPDTSNKLNPENN